MSYFGSYLGAAGGGGADGTPPEVDVITPDAGEAPGSPGAMPSDFNVATNTAIVIDLTDNDTLAYTAVHHRQSDGSLKCVWRRGAFQIGYKNSTKEEISGVVLRLYVRRDEGWEPGPVELLPDIVDAGGNLNADG